MTGQKGDLLIEVTTLSGLALYVMSIVLKVEMGIIKI